MGSKPSLRAPNAGDDGCALKFKRVFDVKMGYGLPSLLTREGSASKLKFNLLAEDGSKAKGDVAAPELGIRAACQCASASYAFSSRITR